MARTAHSARKAVPPASSGGTKSSLPGAGGRSLSVRTPVISQQEKPRRKSGKGGAQNVMKEIKYYQSNVGFLIPKASIVKYVRQLVTANQRNLPAEGVRFTANAIGIMHEALENHLVCVLELAHLIARHAKRVTLFQSDIRLVFRIKSTSL